MRTVTLGGTLGVSALGLGCMPMSEFYGERDDAASLRVLDRALELGITFFDTADAYGIGHNEELLGRWLDRGGHRDAIVLASKFGLVRDPDDPGARGIDGRPDYVRRSCDASLRRLGVDVIDLYYQHRADPKTPVEETVGAMAELVTAGKVRHLGLSEAAPDTIRRAAAVHPVTAVQSEWSLWSRDIEDEVLGTCRELGIGLVPYSPLGRGFLTGAITRPSDLGADDFRLTNPRFQGENFQRNLDVVARVRELAVAKGVTPGQLALAWVLARGDDVAPIPATTKVHHLEENVQALEIELTAADLDAIEEVAPRSAFAGPRYGDMRFVAGVTPPGPAAG